MYHTVYQRGQQPKRKFTITQRWPNPKIERKRHYCQFLVRRHATRSSAPMLRNDARNKTSSAGDLDVFADRGRGRRCRIYRRFFPGISRRREKAAKCSRSNCQLGETRRPLGDGSIWVRRKKVGLLSSLYWDLVDHEIKINVMADSLIVFF